MMIILLLKKEVIMAAPVSPSMKYFENDKSDAVSKLKPEDIGFIPISEKPKTPSPTLSGGRITPGAASPLLKATLVRAQSNPNIQR